MIVAGANAEIEDSGLTWQTWPGDTSAAFLQGKHKERTLPLFLRPPSDGLITRHLTGGLPFTRFAPTFTDLLMRREFGRLK